LTLKDRVEKLEEQVPQPIKLELDDGQVVMVDDLLDLLSGMIEAMRYKDIAWLDSDEAYIIAHLKKGQHSITDLVIELFNAYQKMAS